MVTSGKGHVYYYIYTHDNSLHIEVSANMIHIILDLLINTQTTLFYYPTRDLQGGQSS